MSGHFRAKGERGDCFDVELVDFDPIYYPDPWTLVPLSSRSGYCAEFGDDEHRVFVWHMHQETQAADIYPSKQVIAVLVPDGPGAWRPAGRHVTEGDPLPQVRFSVVDLDHDGSDEALITWRTPGDQLVHLDVVDIVDGTPQVAAHIDLPAAVGLGVRDHYVEICDDGSPVGTRHGVAWALVLQAAHPDHLGVLFGQRLPVAHIDHRSRLADAVDLRPWSVAMGQTRLEVVGRLGTLGDPDRLVVDAATATTSPCGTLDRSARTAAAGGLVFVCRSAVFGSGPALRHSGVHPFPCRQRADKSTFQGSTGELSPRQSGKPSRFEDGRSPPDGHRSTPICCVAITPTPAQSRAIRDDARHWLDERHLRPRASDRPVVDHGAKA